MTTAGFLLITGAAGFLAVICFIALAIGRRFAPEPRSRSQEIWWGLVQLLATASSAVAGVLVAFTVDKHGREIEQREQRVEDGNAALFTLIEFQDVALSIERGLIQGACSNSNEAFFDLDWVFPIPEINRELDISKLAFLVSDHLAVVERARASAEGMLAYLARLVAWQDLSRAYLLPVEDRLVREGKIEVLPDGSYEFGEMEGFKREVGVLTFSRLEHLAKSLIDEPPVLCMELAQSHRELADALRDVLPGPFIEIPRETQHACATAMARLKRCRGGKAP